MMRLLSLAAASAALATAADVYDDDADLNFLRLLSDNTTNNASATTVPATTVPATTVPATTVASSSDSNATTLPATTLPPSSTNATTLPPSQGGETTKPPGGKGQEGGDTTQAPAGSVADSLSSGATQAPDAPAVEGTSFTEESGSTLSFPPEIGGSQMFTLITQAMIDTFKESQTAGRLRMLNATSGNGTSTTGAPTVTTVTGSSTYDSKWTKATSGPIDMAATIPPASSRRKMQDVTFTDTFKFKVFSTDPAVVNNAKAASDTQKAAVESGSALTALKTKLKTIITQNEALIAADVSGFNASSVTAAIDAMTVTVTVSAVAADTSKPAPAASTTSGAAQVTAFVAIATAALASLF